MSVLTVSALALIALLSGSSEALSIVRPKDEISELNYGRIIRRVPREDLSPIYGRSGPIFRRQIEENDELYRSFGKDFQVYNKFDQRVPVGKPGRRSIYFSEEEDNASPRNAKPVTRRVSPRSDDDEFPWLAAAGLAINLLKKKKDDDLSVEAENDEFPWLAAAGLAINLLKKKKDDDLSVEAENDEFPWLSAVQIAIQLLKKEKLDSEAIEAEDDEYNPWTFKRPINHYPSWIYNLKHDDDEAFEVSIDRD